MREKLFEQFPRCGSPIFDRRGRPSDRAGSTGQNLGYSDAVSSFSSRACG
jgi:hypothetical protein